MAGRFITALEVALVSDGPARWRILKPLVYESPVHGLLIVPSDFETDFASVPRLPLAFLLAGDTCHRAAVIHDWLYSVACGLDRAQADAVLREAAAAAGEPLWRRWLVWLGVRVGGGAAYRPGAAP